MTAVADDPDTDGLDVPPPDAELAARPIVFLKAQIAFLRHLCGLLNRLRLGADDALARTVYRAICGDLGLLLQDRRANLMPVLRRRAVEADDVEQLFAALEDSYRGVEQEAEKLARALNPRAPASGGRRAVGDPAGGLAQRLRHLVAIESAILIPLVRVRLSADDYDLLTAAFRARREPRAPRPAARS